MFCLSGTTVYAIDFEDVYLTGGVVHWPKFGPTTDRFSIQFPTTSYERTSTSSSSTQTSFKFGAGYYINESWSVEAVAIVGMEHESSIPSLFGRFFTEIPDFMDEDFDDEFEVDFDIALTRKLKASILRINPVYTIPIQGNFSLFGKAGIAFIERDVKMAIRSDYEFNSELGQEVEIVFPSSLQVFSESDSTTNLFASTGLTWSPGGGRSAISISYSNYFDTPGDVTNSVELDYQWRF